MPQKIDELQLDIGSDASGAIRQLESLSAALSTAASNARQLASGTSFLLHFGNALSKISSINMDKTIAGLEKLQRMDLSNLKDKTVHLDFTVTGADRVDRLKVATAQASKDIQKSANSIAKGLGQEFNVDTAGVKEFRTIIKDVMKDIANGGDGASGMEQLRASIEENSRISRAELTGMAEEYDRFLRYINSIKINPAGMSGFEHNEWVKSGLLGLLKNNGLGLDTLMMDFSGDLFTQHPGIIDFFSIPKNQQDQFVYLREKILEAKQALHDFGGNADLFGRMDEAVSETGEKIRELLEESISQNMVESGNKIPIDLDIDQNRFEAQIQKAINEATSKTYTHKPIKIDIETQTLRNNISKSLDGIDVGQLPQFADRFKTISDAISQMNQTKLQDTGVVQFTNALRRLASADMSKFNTQALQDIVASLNSLAGLGDVSKSLNQFISSIARLANAGENTEKTAQGLKVLLPELQAATTVFQALGTIDESITGFVRSISQLATAGEKVDKSAQGIQNLGDAVYDFLTKMSNAPAIDANIAQTIAGIGNLAQAGARAGRVMGGLGSSGSGSNSSLFVSIRNGASGATSALKKLSSVAIDLGKKGLSSIGSFFGKLGLMPGYTKSIDRMALSFGNLFRAVVPFYGLSGVFNWLKEAVMTGSNIVEVENVIDTMFGTLGKGYDDLSGLIYKWANTTIDAFGVSELGARQYVGRIMAMFNSSGFDVTEGMRDKAAQMSMSLVEIAGDLASFYDIDVDEAMTKIQAGLAGMNRPLRSLGINLSVANLQQHALTMGITESWKNMDQATQMLVRYEYLVNATKYAQGDFAKTSQTFANQVRLLSLNFQVLSSTVGQGLISAVAPAISWINVLIRRLIQAANAFRTFMFTIFGKAIGAAKGVVNDLAGYADDASDSLGGVGDSGSGLGSAADSAKDLAKQLSVLPFDELNQLSKDTSSAGSGGSGSGSGGGGVGGLGDLFGESFLDATDLDGSEIQDAISRWGAKIKAAFQGGAWIKLGKEIAEGLNDGFQYVYDILSWENWEDKVMGFIEPFSTTINSMMHFLDWDLIGRTFGNGLNTITYVLDNFITSFDFHSYGVDFATGMNGFLDEWDAPAFGKLIADKFMIAWNTFSGWVHTFNFAGLGTRIKEALISAMNNINWTDIGNSTGSFITGLGTTLKNIFEDGTVRENFRRSVSDFLEGFFNGFSADEIKDGLSAAGSSILGGLGDALMEHKDEIAQAFKDLLGGLPWDTIVKVAAAAFAVNFGASLSGTAIKAMIAKAIMGGGSGAGAGALGTGAAGLLGNGGNSLFAALVGNGAVTAGLGALGGVGAFTIGAGLLRELGVTASGAELSSQDLSFVEGEYGDKTVNLSAKTDTSFKDAQRMMDGLSKGAIGTVSLYAKETASFVTGKTDYNNLQDKKNTKTLDATRTAAFISGANEYHGVTDKLVKKTMDGLVTEQFKTSKIDYNSVVSNTAVKTASGEVANSFKTTKTEYNSVSNKTAKVTADGVVSGNFNTVKNAVNNIPSSKTVKINLAKGSGTSFSGYSGGEYVKALKISWNALGGLFLGPTVMQGFGESGPEAALPLRNKRSMSMIANAIAGAGGVSNIDTDRMARTIANAVISAISGQNERPINLNAVLYTENDEVLARAVDRGRRSLDKRYNPVSQYSYG